jgi:hypothetical protein
LEADIYWIHCFKDAREQVQTLLLKEERVPEGGKHKWKKRNVKKIQLVKHVIKPVLAVSMRKKYMLRRD